MYYSEMDDSSEEEEDSEMYDYEEEEEDSDDSSEEKEVRQKKKVRKQKEVRNWLELPPDVMSLIFMKLDTIDILFRVQSVCSSWRKLAKEPQLYRAIDMQKQWEFFFGRYDMEKLAREAVDRSCGQLVKFSVEHFATDELLLYITDKCSSLRCLRLVSCYQVYDDAMIEAAKKLPLLEEIEFCFCSFSLEVIEALGRSCLRLKSFRLNRQGYKGPVGDEEALTIAQNMPELRHLNLFGNFLTDNGVQAILDGCPHLKSLDLRQCFNVKFAGDLRKRCADGNVKLRLPNDSTHDYEFDATFNVSSYEYGPYD